MVSNEPESRSVSVLETEYSLIILQRVLVSKPEKISRRDVGSSRCDELMTWKIGCENDSHFFFFNHNHFYSTSASRLRLARMFTFRQEGRVNSANLSSLGRVESLAADWSKETSKQTFAIQPPDLSPMANTQAALLPSRSKSEEERKRLDSPTERFGDKGSPALRLLHQNEEVVQDPKQQSDKKKSHSKRGSRSNRLSNSMKPRQQSKTAEQVDSANLLESDKPSKAGQMKEGEEPLSSFLVPRMKSISNVVPSNEEEPKDQEEILPSALVSGHSATKRKRDKGKEKEQEGIKEAQPRKSSKSKTDFGAMEAKKKKTKEGKTDKDQEVETEEAEYEAEASKREYFNAKMRDISNDSRALTRSY